MTNLWKLRLSLMVLMLIGLGVMTYFMGHEPQSMQNKLGMLLGFLVFFGSAMVLLYTSQDDAPTWRERQRKEVARRAGPEHHFRSIGGGSGGGNGC